MVKMNTAFFMTFAFLATSAASAAFSHIGADKDDGNIPC